MTRTFVETPLFTHRWYELGFTDEDLLELQKEILQNPDIGDLIVGTGGIRKMRFAFKNRGKSGSVRVCYIDFIVDRTVHLITVYAKTEQDNLTDFQKKELKKLVKALHDA